MRLPDLSEDEYLAIEEALAANARGRAFLRMRDQRARLVAVEEVRRLVRTLKDSVRRETTVENGPAHIRILRQELHQMSVTIQQTRSEIAALRPDDAGNNRIMAATGELDAIVSATERATSDILNAAERVQEAAGKLRSGGDIATLCDEIEGQTTEILTTCSFQDITGQRTTKVVNALRYLEKRVNAMIEIWGTESLSQIGQVMEREDSRPDAHLLNGPSANGVSQADVDALLAGLSSVTAPKPEPAAEALPPEPPAPPAPKPAKPTASAAPPVPEPPAHPPAAKPNGNGKANNQADIDALFD
jgi:chemotaxis regulatin CheY-phosphate phosphatase CheZ